MKAITQLLMRFSAQDRKQALRSLAMVLEQNRAVILAANQKDVARAKAQKDAAFLDRMTLNDRRFDDMIASTKQIAELPDTVGQLYDKQIRASGITVSKMRVPIGTILMIYESRPNVTIDGAALALKTANAIILKGGREVRATNQALADVIAQALAKSGFPIEAVQVISDDSRQEVSRLLSREDQIDLVIPRGSRRLLEFVRSNTHIPTLLHLEGNCHVYIDEHADMAIALDVVLDAKTQRFGTCNTTESLLIHTAVMKGFLPSLANHLTQAGVEIRGDQQVCELIPDAVAADESDWSAEYLSPIVSIKIVDSVEAAIDHVNHYGSHHTDSIITTDDKAAERFLREVDSASVMRNTSTRLADGYEYGLGAEIGISTGKLHARGPVGQEGLTTYKWIVESPGITKGGIVDRSGEKT